MSGGSLDLVVVFVLLAEVAIRDGKAYRAQDGPAHHTLNELLPDCDHQHIRCYEEHNCRQSYLSRDFI